MSYLIAFLVTKALDYGSSKTNGMFGYNAARKDVEEIDGPKVREQTFRIHGNKTVDDGSSDSSQDAKVCCLDFLPWICLPFFMDCQLKHMKHVVSEPYRDNSNVSA